MLIPEREVQSAKTLSDKINQNNLLTLFFANVVNFMKLLVLYFISYLSISSV